MKGIIVVNGFLQNSRFDCLYQMMKESFEKKNITLDIVKNTEALVYIDHFKHNIDFAIYYDKDELLCKHLENNNIKVFNNSDAIRICDDKGLTHVMLEKSGIRIPKTVISPFTFDNIEYNNFDFLDEIIKYLTLPLVVKENKGSFGSGVYLVNNKEEIIELLKKLKTKRVIFQEYIESSKGRDVRIEIVNHKALGAVMRINENDFRSNVLKGGKMVKYNPDDSFIKMSEKVSRILNLDFCGVDIMIDKNSNPVFCEVNSNLHFKTFYETTNINICDHLRDHIINSLTLKK